MNFIGIFLALAVFLLASFLLNLQTKYIPAFILSALSFSLFKFLTTDEGDAFSFADNKIIRSCSNLFKTRWPLIFAIIYFLSLVSVIFVSPISSIDIDWSNIGFFNWVRLVSAFLAINFLPGYSIISIINKTRDISKIAILMFSFLLSLFITSLFAFLLIATHISFGYIVSSFLTVNFALLIVFSFFKILRKNKKEQDSQFEISSKFRFNISDFYGNLSLILCFILLACGVYIVFSQFSAIRGDMWDHMQRAMLFYKDTMNLPNTTMQLGGNVVSPMDVPYWFHLYLAAFFGVSGIPPMNSYISLAFLNALFMLPPYLVANAFFKGNKKPVVLTTIIFSIGAGFGWIFVLFLKTQASVPISNAAWINILATGIQKTAEDVYSNLSFFFLEFKTRTIGLMALFTLVYIMIEKKLSNIFKGFLIVTFTALGYLFHVSEILIFIVVFLPCSLIFSKKISVQTSRITCLSTAIGLVIVALLDLMTSSQFYITGGFLRVAIILSLACSAISLLKGRGLFSKFVPRFSFNWSKLAKVIFVLVCFVFALSFIVLNVVWPNYFTYLTDQSGLYPWYFYPFRFGTAFIFMIIALAFLAFKGLDKDFDFIFMVALIVVLFLFGKTISYINIYIPPTIIQTGYYERRFLELMLLPISILAGFGIYKVSSLIMHRNHRNIIKWLMISVLTFVIVISSFSSLLSVENFALTSHPWSNSGLSTVPQYELDGLNFIKDNASPNSYVLTYTSASASTLSLAGVRVPYTASSDLNQFFLTSQPATFFEAISNLKSVGPADYIYLNSRDLQSIPSTSFFESHLAHYLPIAFENEGTIIYKLPNFNPPIISNSSIIYPDTQSFSESQYLPLDAIAMSSYGYDLQLSQDPNRLNNSNIILPQDISTYEPDDLNQVDAWTAFKGGINGTVGIPIISNLTGGSGTLIPSGNSTIVGVYHTFDSYQDWSNHDCLKLNIQGLNTLETIYVDLQAPSSGNEFEFKIIDNWNGSKEVNLSLSNSTVVGSPNIKEIKSIYLFKDTPGNLNFNQFSLGSELGDPLTYENWAAAGGNLIVFNSQGYGDFAKELSINSTGQALVDGISNDRQSLGIPAINITTSSSTDEGVTVLANFMANGNIVSPFAYEKKVGKGEIIYIDVLSLFTQLEGMADAQAKSDLFLKLNSLINMLNLPLSTYVNEEPMDTIYIWGDADFSGNIQIEASSILLQQSSISELSQIDFTHASNPTLIGYPEDSSLIQNVTLMDIQIQGPSSSVVETSYLQKQSSASGMGAYVPLLFKNGLNWTIVAGTNTTVELWIRKDNVPIQLITHGGTITLSFDNSVNYSVLTKAPLVTVTGNAYLERAYFDWPYWNAPIKRDISLTSPSTLNGTFQFKIGYADTTYFFLGAFTLDGSGNVIGLSQFSEWAIPWVAVLTSPWFILLLGLISVFTVWYLRRHFRKP